MDLHRSSNPWLGHLLTQTNQGVVSFCMSIKVPTHSPTRSGAEQLTIDTMAIMMVSLRFFMHMALARFRLVVLKVTDYGEEHRRERATDVFACG